MGNNEPNGLTPTIKTFNFLTGVFVGALIGTAIGLLLAPRSGTESRHQIAEGLRDSRERSNRYLEETRQNTERSFHHVRNSLESKFSLLLAAVKAGRQAARRNPDNPTSEVITIRAEVVGEK